MFLKANTYYISRILDNKPTSPLVPSLIRSETTNNHHLLDLGAPLSETLGDWNIDVILEIHAPPSACYESLVNNIVTPLMRFQGYEYPPGTVSPIAGIFCGPGKQTLMAFDHVAMVRLAQSYSRVLAIFLEIVRDRQHYQV